MKEELDFNQMKKEYFGVVETFQISLVKLKSKLFYMAIV